MKIINFFSLILFVLIFNSCTSVTKKLDNLTNNPNTNIDTIKKKSPQLINKCIEKEENILLENKLASNFYTPLLNHILFKNRSFIDKSLLILLSEMSRRPDALSPQSRFQIYIKTNGNYKYYDFRPKILSNNETTPLLYGINSLSKEFKSTNLKQMASELEFIHPKQIPMDEEFEQFLKTNYKEILSDKLASNLYLKGDEVITHYETFTRLNYHQIINSINSNILNKDLYEYNINELKKNKLDKNVDSFCNFDLTSDSDLKYSMDNLNNEQVHYIGFKNGKNLFLAVFSSVIKHPLSIKNNSFYFNSISNPLPIPICLFQNKEQNLLLTSLAGRSKSQHLKHLNDYQIYFSKNNSELIDVLNFPRHLFLPGPDRILYESKKGRKDQLNFFLSMNFPIYHVEDLGNIIGVFEPNSKFQQFIVDDRTKSSIECSK